MAISGIGKSDEIQTNNLATKISEEGGRAIAEGINGSKFAEPSRSLNTKNSVSDFLKNFSASLK